MFRIWAGIDIGKEHHHCVALDARGDQRLSRRVGNDEPELLELIQEVLALADQGEVLWAVDTNHGSAALLIGLLLGHGQPMVYPTGLAIHRASAGYRGQVKTDAKDTYFSADQARMRQDLGRLRPGDEVAVDLRILTARRCRPPNSRRHYWSPNSCRRCSRHRSIMAATSPSTHSKKASVSAMRRPAGVSAPRLLTPSRSAPSHRLMADSRLLRAQHRARPLIEEDASVLTFLLPVG